MDVAETDDDVRNQNDETKYHRPDIIVAILTIKDEQKSKKYLWIPPMMVQKVPVNTSNNGASARIWVPAHGKQMGHNC